MRSESVLGLCTGSRALLLKQQYLNFFRCTLRFWKPKISCWKTTELHWKAAFQMFFHNVFSEYAWTPGIRRNPVGRSVWIGAGQLCLAWSAVPIPRCQHWGATELWPCFSAGWLLSDENFACWKFLWSTPCIEARGGGSAQISTVTVKVWLTVHMHTKASGPWPSLKSRWQGKATVRQGTSCWRQLQRGEETLWSRSLLLEESSLGTELLTSLVKVHCLGSWSFILLTALCSQRENLS